MFGRHRTIDAPTTSEIIFPTDADLKRPIPSPYKLQKKHSLASVASPTSPQFQREPTFLRKHRKKGVRGFRRTREAVKFSPLNVEDLSSDSDENSDGDDSKPPSKRWAVEHRPSLSRNSSVTLADEDMHRSSAEKDVQLEPPRLRTGIETPDYSDFEDDVTAGATRRPPSALDGAGWQPGFLRRASLKAESEAHTSPSGVPSQRSAPSSQRTAVEQPGSSSLPGSSVPPAFTPVPATPSLIRAIERVQAAYNPATSPAHDAASAEPKGPKWNSFWQEVKAKAGHEHPHASGIPPPH